MVGTLSTNAETHLKGDEAMPDTESPDPPEDAPPATNSDERDILRARLEDARGVCGDEPELTALRRQQGPPDA